jgi:hypothetical protein
MRMVVFHWILVCSWAPLLITWFGAAWRQKRTSHGSPCVLLGLAGFIAAVITLHFMLPHLPKELVTPRQRRARRTRECCLGYRDRVRDLVAAVAR